MSFDLIKGSGNRVMSTVRIDSRNASAQVWFCTKKEEWHWSLVWEDGGPYGTHMHNGIASTRLKARADMVKAIIFTEDTWPRYEYFEHNW
jgi:hypothetical protein